jgi:hypothetical protein
MYELPLLSLGVNVQLRDAAQSVSVVWQKAFANVVAVALLDDQSMAYGPSSARSA